MSPKAAPAVLFLTPRRPLPTPPQLTMEGRMASGGACGSAGRDHSRQAGGSQHGKGSPSP